MRSSWCEKNEALVVNSNGCLSVRELAQVCLGGRGYTWNVPDHCHEWRDIDVRMEIVRWEVDSGEGIRSTR